MINLVRAISENGGIVATAIDSTTIVRQMEAYHQPSAVVSAALGRLLTGAALMGSQLKHPDDSLTLRIHGNGPIGNLVVASDGEGNVRGYAENNIVELPLREDGKLNVGEAVGRNGTLTVIRDTGEKKPYMGQIELVSGEIAEDLTAYFATSEQVPTVCSLGVLVNKDLSIQNSGGYLLQLLPGADEKEIEIIENNIKNTSPITSLLQEKKPPKDIINIIMGGFSPQILEEKELNYRCYCGVEKTESILKSLGQNELDKMMAEDPFAEAVCHFCNTKYKIDLRELIKKQ